MNPRKRNGLRIRTTASGRKKTAAQKRMTARNQKTRTLAPRAKILVNLTQMDRKTRAFSRTVAVILQMKTTITLTETNSQKRNLSRTAILQKRMAIRSPKTRMLAPRMKIPVNPMETDRKTVSQKGSLSRMENPRIMPEIRKICRKQGKNQRYL